MAKNEVSRELSAWEKQIKANREEIKNTNLEVKALDKALQIDPKNVELLGQKMNTFSKQIELGEKKAGLLQEQIDSLKNTTTEADQKTEKYKNTLANLETQLRVTTIETDSLNTSLQIQKDKQQQIGNSNLIKTIKDLKVEYSGLSIAISGVNSVFNGLNNLIKDWNNMSWFQRTVQAITITMTGLATAIGIMKAVTLNPLEIGKMIVGIGLVSAAIMGAMSLFNNKNVETRSAGDIATGTIGGGEYPAYVEGMYNDSVEASPYNVNASNRTPQATTSSMNLNINVSGADMYNEQIGKDIAKVLLEDRDFLNGINKWQGTIVK